MVGTRGGAKADNVLFGKYRLDRVIGRGRTGTVWLAVHLGLDEYRAVKQIPREAVRYEAFLREATILKSLHHPAIPMIYDLEEDQNFLYLIQEYIRGKSLYALIQDQGVLQEPEAIRYGLQICALVKFLHVAGEEPILFLDLQPNNLMICANTVKLVDFGEAAFAKKMHTHAGRYATQGCAAPEQYTFDRDLDVRTDLYAIGAVLSFMVSGEAGVIPDTASSEFAGIIGKCMQSDETLRYGSVEELETCLQGLMEKMPKPRKEKCLPSLVVMVAGSRDGVGATHLALSLGSYLERSGTSCVYEEHNHSGDIRRMGAILGARPDERGLLFIGGLRVKPWYGAAIRLEQAWAQVRVLDFGMEWKNMEENAGEENAAIVMVAGGSLWEMEGCAQMVRELGAVVSERKRRLLIFPSRAAVRTFRGLFPKEAKVVRVFICPHIPDSFRPGREGTSFLQEIWAVIGQPGKKGWWERRKRAE